MVYKLIILSDEFEELVTSFIHSTLQQGDCPGDQDDYDQRFDAIRGLLHMHWLGMLEFKGLPKNMQEPITYTVNTDVNDWEDGVYSQFVPVVNWKGEDKAVTDVRQILAAVAVDIEAPDMNVYSRYSTMTEQMLASDDATLNTMLVEKVDRLKQAISNMHLGLLFNKALYGGKQKWILN